MAAQTQPRRLSTAPWDSGEFSVDALTRQPPRKRRVRSRSEHRDDALEAELEWVDLDTLLDD